MAPCSMQLAAIHTSLIGMGFPLERSCFFMRANHSDVVSVIGTQIVRGFDLNRFSISRFSRSRLPPMKPSMSSPITTGVKRTAPLWAKRTRMFSFPLSNAVYAFVSIRTRSTTASRPHRFGRFQPEQPLKSFTTPLRNGILWTQQPHFLPFYPHQ